MNILAIDIGSYSVKFVEAFVEKKKTTILSSSEIVLDQYRQKNTTVVEQQELQFEIIKEYLAKISANVRIVFQVPFELVTNRFLVIPVKNKRKAEQMIPFQLEEDIPYPLSESHYASYLIPMNKSTDAFISIINKKAFDELHQRLNKQQLLPSILTYEATAFAAYVEKNNLTGPLCFMDMGHSLTKAYFFNEGKLVFINSSYVGGKDINEFIVKNYGISLEEVIAYKHRNCFLLTENQYSDVNESQKEFALLMHQVFSTLINDFKKWDIGFRIAYGARLNNVFITGGTSQIKGVTHYLTMYLDTRVQKFNPYSEVDNLAEASPESMAKYSVANLMARAARGKTKLINFLTGNYSHVTTDEFPIHSLSFIGSRMLYLSMVLLAFLGIEMFMLQSKITDLDKRIQNNYLKNPVLEFSPKDRRSFNVEPEKIFTKLKRKQKFIEQEIKTIQSAAKINSIAPLIKLSNIVGSTNEAALVSFDSDETGYVKGTFTAEEIEPLKALDSILKGHNFSGLNTNLNELKKQFTFEFSGGE
ncbi:MAG: pilus assembly protein PilM [Bacteriovoracaceae bacterium]|nr:pilus assembly protein PilM [Bacteriovoracaceae bacterium]